MAEPTSYGLRNLPPELLAHHLKSDFGILLEPRGLRREGNLFVHHREGGLPLEFDPWIKRLKGKALVAERVNLLSGEALILADWSDRWHDLSEAVLQSGIKDLIEAFGRHSLELSDPPPFLAGEHSFEFGKPRVMGILNLTPDSFYDGGEYLEAGKLAKRIRRMIEEGADLLDLGGESTRPGSKPVEASEQIRRILPALETITAHWSIPVSVDTSDLEVARVCLEKGASIVNDVSGLSEGAAMARLVAKHKAGYVLMHTQGRPETMQEAPSYEAPLLELMRFFRAKCRALEAEGVDPASILLDPGIGFGKLLVHNLDLLRFLPAFLGLGKQLLLGTSNKSFLGQVLGKEKDQRLYGTLATQVMGFARGASFFRVHEVGPTQDALKMTELYYRN